ncbi:hypothetical protein KC333_g6747 [Hortaea werneckii]|nr:hypothetical protein KC333_g6747 [Hortaea werneckii]KAI7310529.1 hypothetical protein KC326_g6650 [Hortaea werneckii]
MIQAVDQMYEALGYTDTRQIVKDQEYLFTQMSWPEMEQFLNSFLAKYTKSGTAQGKTVAGATAAAPAATTSSNNNNDNDNNHRPAGASRQNDNNRRSLGATSRRQTSMGGNGLFQTPSPTRSDTIMGDGSPQPSKVSLPRNNLPSLVPREDTGFWGGNSRIPRPVAGEEQKVQRPPTSFGRPGVQGRAEIPLRTTPNNRTGASSRNATAPAFGSRQSPLPGTNEASRTATTNERMEAEMERWRAELGI